MKECTARRGSPGLGLGLLAHEEVQCSAFWQYVHQGFMLASHSMNEEPIEVRRRRLMRKALTAATSNYGIGGRLKTQATPKPVTLAGKVPFMSRTFTTIHVVMRDGAPVGAYTDREEAMAHSRAIGGPGKGHSIGFVTLQLVHGGPTHGPGTDADQQDRPGEPGDREAKRR